jgi:UDP-N-acetylglucosamine enolpyruvyl transferase
VENLDRGYEALDSKLAALGARIGRGDAPQVREAG